MCRSWVIDMWKRYLHIFMSRATQTSHMGSDAWCEIYVFGMIFPHDTWSFFFMFYMICFRYDCVLVCRLIVSKPSDGFFSHISFSGYCKMIKRYRLHVPILCLFLMTILRVYKCLLIRMTWEWGIYRFGGRIRFFYFFGGKIQKISFIFSIFSTPRAMDSLFYLLERDDGSYKVRSLHAIEMLSNAPRYASSVLHSDSEGYLLVRIRSHHKTHHNHKYA